MRVNGTEIQLDSTLPLLVYLEQAQYQTARIAVEINGQIVPKAKYAETMLNPDDVLEIVSFVGGG